MDNLYTKPSLDITYQHGNKYTKSWIGFCAHELGGFSLSYLYNGGRFSSEKEILQGIESLKNEGWPVNSIKKEVNK